MSSGGTAAAFVALAPEFERATGHKVVTLATSTGLGADSIASRVRRGEPVDVIILSRAQIEVDRKVLADIAVFDQEGFAALAAVAKEALASA